MADESLLNLKHLYYADAFTLYLSYAQDNYGIYLNIAYDQSKVDNRFIDNDGCIFVLRRYDSDSSLIIAY